MFSLRLLFLFLLSLGIQSILAVPVPTRFSIYSVSSSSSYVDIVTLEFVTRAAGASPSLDPPISTLSPILESVPTGSHVTNGFSKRQDGPDGERDNGIAAPADGGLDTNLLDEIEEVFPAEFRVYTKARTTIVTLPTGSSPFSGTEYVTTTTTALQSSYPSDSSSQHTPASGTTLPPSGSANSPGPSTTQPVPTVVLPDPMAVSVIQQLTVPKVYPGDPDPQGLTSKCKPQKYDPCVNIDQVLRDPAVVAADLKIKAMIEKADKTFVTTVTVPSATATIKATTPSSTSSEKDKDKNMVALGAALGVGLGVPVLASIAVGFSLAQRAGGRAFWSWLQNEFPQTAEDLAPKLPERWPFQSDNFDLPNDFNPPTPPSTEFSLPDAPTPPESQPEVSLPDGTAPWEPFEWDYEVDEAPTFYNAPGSDPASPNPAIPNLSTPNFGSPFAPPGWGRVGTGLISAMDSIVPEAFPFSGASIPAGVPFIDTGTLLFKLLNKPITAARTAGKELLRKEKVALKTYMDTHSLSAADAAQLEDFAAEDFAARHDASTRMWGETQLDGLWGVWEPMDPDKVPDAEKRKEKKVLDAISKGLNPPDAERARTTAEAELENRRTLQRRLGNAQSQLEKYLNEWHEPTEYPTLENLGKEDMWIEVIKKGLPDDKAEEEATKWRNKLGAMHDVARKEWLQRESVQAEIALLDFIRADPVPVEEPQPADRQHHKDLLKKVPGGYNDRKAAEERVKLLTEQVEEKYETNRKTWKEGAKKKGDPCKGPGSMLKPSCPGWSMARGLVL